MIEPVPRPLLVDGAAVADGVADDDDASELV